MAIFLKDIFRYVFVFWLLNIGLGYYLSSYEKQDLNEVGQFYPILRWEDYYQETENIDVLVLGSSHAYRAFDPQVIERELEGNKKVFNFGSAAQTPVTSYFVLQEVLEKHRPKLVIYDIYFMVFTSNDQLRNGRFNWQQMKGGNAKRKFFLNGFSMDEKVALSLFPAYVYKDYIKSKINKLLGRNYMPLPKGTYQGKGFVSKSDTLSLEELQYSNQFDVFEIDTDALLQRNLEYLEHLKNYCADKQIELVFTSSPMPAISVEKIATYTRFYHHFNLLAEQWGIRYLDYNMKRVKGLSDASHYYDDDHMNRAGAKVFSSAFANDLNQLK